MEDPTTLIEVIPLNTETDIVLGWSLSLSLRLDLESLWSSPTIPKNFPGKARQVKDLEASFKIYVSVLSRSKGVQTSSVCTETSSACTDSSSTVSTASTSTSWRRIRTHRPGNLSDYMKCCFRYQQSHITVCHLFPSSKACLCTCRLCIRTPFLAVCRA
jgi:hypothetical protein